MLQELAASTLPHPVGHFLAPEELKSQFTSELEQVPYRTVTGTLNKPPHNLGGGSG